MDDDQQHELLREEVAAHALGILDPAATARVERHLAGCPACSTLATEYLAVVDLIPLGRPPVAPPLGGGARLLARARAHDGRRIAAIPGWRAWPAGRAAAIAVVLVAAITLGVILGRGALERDPASGDPAVIVAQLHERDDVRVLALAGSPAAPGGRAELLLPAAGSIAGLTVRDLPPLPPGRSYQLWFVQPDQTRVSGGVFAVDDQGDGVSIVAVPRGLDGFTRVGVTEEPKGGSPAPTGANVLTGAL